MFFFFFFLVSLVSFLFLFLFCLFVWWWWWCRWGEGRWLFGSRLFFGRPSDADGQR